jgi:hypothetical protein
VSHFVLTDLCSVHRIMEASRVLHGTCLEAALAARRVLDVLQDWTPLFLIARMTRMILVLNGIKGDEGSLDLFHRGGILFGSCRWRYWSWWRKV